uniref:Maturation n=2 Tax=Leviviricetes TaxID=2842243 RepID=A0A514CZV9_9VIRU|nr:MAG: hypothetical protein H1Rhizo25914_000001 [Leviviridae sp.]
MPTRIRTSPSQQSSVQPPAATYHNGVFSNLFNDFANYPIAPNYRYMRDVVGQQGSDNPVNQIEVDLHINGGYSPIVRTSNGVVYSFTPDKGLWIPSDLDGKPQDVVWWPWLPPISAATLSNWAYEGFNKFSSQVPEEISLANSLYELKDLKAMIPKIERSVTKTAANNFLLFEFGVKPMISDIKAVVGLSEAVDKRIKHLIDVNGRTTQLAMDKFVELTTPFSFFISNNSISSNVLTDYTGRRGQDQGVVFERISGRQSFHLGGRLTQDLEDLRAANAKLKGLVAASGFNRPGRIIWNAIPYSFVVDWFFSVGKLIDTIAVQPFGGKYDVSHVMWSVKSEATYKVYVTWGSAGSFVPNEEFVGTARVKIYERYTGFPASSVFLTDGSLSPEQQVLGLAMLEQKRR